MLGASSPSKKVCISQALPREASFINTNFAYLRKRSRTNEDEDFIILPTFHVHKSSSSSALEYYNPPSFKPYATRLGRKDYEDEGR